MKKYFYIALMFFLSIIIFYYVRCEAEFYFITKYQFSNIAIRIILSIVVTLVNLLYVYITIYQYEFIRENIIIRLGKAGYKKTIVAIYSKSILFFILFNLLIDFLISNEINVSDIVINGMLLMIPLIYLRNCQRYNNYFLFYSCIFITLSKLIIFSCIK